MKKLLLICLLPGCRPCFAQNVGLKELLRVMEAPSVEWVNQYLAPLGYIAGKKEVVADGIDKASTHVWGFKSGTNSEEPMVAELYRIADTAGIKLVYETSNPFFYTNLLNQLPMNNFLFRQSTTVDNQINLNFNNSKYELLLEFVPDTHLDKPYTITLRPVNKFQTTATQPKIRVNEWKTSAYDHNSTIRLNQ